MRNGTKLAFPHLLDSEQYTVHRISIQSDRGHPTRISGEQINPSNRMHSIKLFRIFMRSQRNFSVNASHCWFCQVRKRGFFINRTHALSVCLPVWPRPGKHGAEFEKNRIPHPTGRPLPFTNRQPTAQLVIIEGQLPGGSPPGVPISIQMKGRSLRDLPPDSIITSDAAGRSRQLHLSWRQEFPVDGYEQTSPARI